MAEQETSQNQELDFAKTHCATCKGGMAYAKVDKTPMCFCLLMHENTTDPSGKSLLSACRRYEPQD